MSLSSEPLGATKICSSRGESAPLSRRRVNHEGAIDTRERLGGLLNHYCRGAV